MDRRQLKGAIDRAMDAVTGSFIARTQASRAREAWRAWREQWAQLEQEPPADRMLAVCMYCERFRANTGEWVATPPWLTEMLHDPKVVQLTHGACPICLAQHLERSGENPSEVYQGADFLDRPHGPRPLPPSRG